VSSSRRRRIAQLRSLTVLEVLGDAWLGNDAARLDDRRSGGGGRWWHDWHPCQWLGRLIRSTTELVAGASWQRCLTPACYTRAGVEASGGDTHNKAELGSTPPAWDGATPEVRRRADMGEDWTGRRMASFGRAFMPVRHGDRITVPLSHQEEGENVGTNDEWAPQNFSISDLTNMDSGF
jgi:hypothetical protein